MNQCFAVLLGICLNFLFLSASTAQQQLPDSVVYQESIDHLHGNYFSQIGENAQLYNGSEYIRNGQIAKGFPFFESDSILNGQLSYQGIRYIELKLQYDLVSDQLITYNYAHNALISLSKEKIDSFVIDSHFFIRIPESKESANLKGDGYYERLTHTETAVYAKREKKLVVPSGEGDAKYVQYNTYYIKMNNRFYPVDGERAVLDLFNDHRDDVKKFIRSNKVKFKKRFEEALVQTTTYYSQLKH
jgi:hypothetical protein